MTSVLLTGAGGAAVPWLIPHLRSQGYRVLAADMDPYAVGLRLADAGYVVPAGHDPKFLPALERLCRDARVDVVVPLVDEEILSALKVERMGIRVLAPRESFTRVCLDKYLLVQELREHAIATPRTGLAADSHNDLEFPLVVKPRVGRGSRGVAVVGSEQELNAAIGSSSFGLEELMVQELIEGDEFTVSVVAWRDREVRAVVPKKVIVKRGITHLAITQRHEGIDKLCHRIQESLRADGPFNVQLRVDSKTGQPLPFEINPRYSTTVTLTTASGVDEVGGLVKLAMGCKRVSFGPWTEGLVLMRHMQDAFMQEEEWLEHAVRDYSGGPKK